MSIYDIAKLAGVSPSTVSKVINGKDKDISESTKQKVLEVVEKENFVPYMKFLDKEGIKTRLIGLILKKDNRERETLMLGIEEAAREAGYGLLVSYAENEEDLTLCAEEMIRKKAQGLLIDSEKPVMSGPMESATVYLNQSEAFDEAEKAVFYYRLCEAGRTAAESLLHAGHERIACLVLERDRGILVGYQTAMRNAGITVDQLWMFEAETLADIEEFGIRQCLAGDVTGVICGNPETAGCFSLAMARMHMAVPDSVSLITVGDNRWMEITGIGITAVRLPAREMGRAAFSCLSEMLREEKRIEIRRCFTSTLVERASVIPPVKGRKGEKIVVVGRMVMDVTVEVARTPVKGETQLADDLYLFPGGKGANQAVGAGKLGGRVYLIGCLGKDIEGKQIYGNLLEAHVNTAGVLYDPELSTGMAYITVDRSGESTIVVYQGANKSLNIEQIKRSEYIFDDARYCLISTENPCAVTAYTVRFCRRNNIQVLMKPSATTMIKDDLLQDIAYLIPNENELHSLVPGDHSIEEKAQILLDKGVEHVIVTLGERGCYLRNREISVYFEGSGFKAVDTTGGADSFISALAVYLSEGRTLLEAIGFAVYASGISVTGRGVQPALPERKAVDLYEDEIRAKYRAILEGENH